MRRERGSALLVTVMMMVLLGMLGLAALDTVTSDQQVAGFQNRSRAAFYAAEAGLAQAQQVLLGVIADTETPSLASGQLGDTSIYPYGRPSYSGDPDFTDPIRSVGTRLDMTGANLRGGRPVSTVTLWQVNVRGQTVDGASSRVEAVVVRPGEAAGYGG
jgi:hypothetical protein